MLTAVSVIPLQAHSPCVMGLVQTRDKVFCLARGKVNLPLVCVGKHLLRFAEGQREIWGRSRVNPGLKATQSHPSTPKIVLCLFVRNHLGLLLNTREAGEF